MTNTLALALLGVIVAQLATLVTVVVYLGGRIDRLADRVGAVEVAVARLDQRFIEHERTTARQAHGQAS